MILLFLLYCDSLLPRPAPPQNGASATLDIVDNTDGTFTYQFYTDLNVGAFNKSEFKLLLPTVQPYRS